MKISVYLFEKDINTIAKAKRTCTTIGYDEIFLTGTTASNNDMQLYVKDTPNPNNPNWVSFLQKSFNWALSSHRNNLSALLLIKRTHQSQDSIFAVSFGSAYTVLPNASLEYFFGLKTALNMLDEEGLKELDSRRIDHNTKNRKMQMSNNSKIEEFEYEQNQDWLFYAYGKTKKQYKNISSSIAGKTQLIINAPDSLDNLQSILDKILEIYLTDQTYKTNFPYLDALQAVPKTSDAAEELNKRLSKNIQKDQGSFFAVAYPEFFQQQPNVFKIYYGHKHEEHETLTASTIRGFGSGIALDKTLDIKIQGGDEEEDNSGNIKFKPSTPIYDIGDFLVSEETYNKKTYVYTWGRWYQIDKTFRDSLVSNLKQNIKDLTTTLNLPKYKKYTKTKKDGTTRDEYDEGEWNKEVFDNKTDYMLLDKKMFNAGQNQKIEICDSLSKDNKLISVKRMKDSATMSHLFNQGYVPAKLLRGDSKFKNKVKKIKNNKWPNNSDLDNPTPCFVFAIPSSKSGEILDNLFLFSQITLDRTAKDIKALGFEVGVCKIEI